MSLWVVVTPQRSPALQKLVIRDVDVERLPDGRYLWTVEAPDDVMEALAESSEGYLSVQRCGYMEPAALTRTSEKVA